MKNIEYNLMGIFMNVEPKVSVIVPMYNGEDYLPTFAQAMKNQLLDTSLFEIIIIDNKSTDRSISLAESLFEGMDVKILSYTDRASSYEARNYGVQNANTEILAFIDIDCLPTRSWLSSMLDVFDVRGLATLVAGNVELKYKESKPNVYELFDNFYFLNQENYSKQKSGATANLAVSKSLFDLVGGFRPVVSGGDRDFCFRVVAVEPDCFVFAKEALIYHPARNTFHEISKKIKRVSKGKVTLARNFSVKDLTKSLIATLAGLVFQRFQIIGIFRCMKMEGVPVWMKLKFAFVSLEFGFYARFILVAGLARILVSLRWNKQTDGRM